MEENFYPVAACVHNAVDGRPGWLLGKLLDKYGAETLRAKMLNAALRACFFLWQLSFSCRRRKTFS